MPRGDGAAPVSPPGLASRRERFREVDRGLVREGADICEDALPGPFPLPFPMGVTNNELSSVSRSALFPHLFQQAAAGRIRHALGMAGEVRYRLRQGGREIDMPMEETEPFTGGGVHHDQERRSVQV